MKVRTIAVAKLRVTGQFENDRAEAVIELEPGDEVAAAIDRAHEVCDQALTAGGVPARTLRTQRRAPPSRPEPSTYPERPIDLYPIPRSKP